MFLHSLSITPLERIDLTACTLYGTKANTDNIEVKLCACYKKLKLKSKRLAKLCQK